MDRFPALLEKLHAKQTLSVEEQAWQKVKERFHRVCDAAYHAGMDSW
jgi:ribosome assembly protein YihI (activator of Der GTPase)